jgi:prepilin-type N-terminal cleavage/methylation domain-containing protein
MAYNLPINHPKYIMQKNRSQGFTLIELLVVIAIIGILSAVVLASLNTARSKGSDAAIQSDLSSVQTQAEITYSTNNSYAAVCTDAAKAIAGAESANGAGTVVCNPGDGTAYAVESDLLSGIKVGSNTNMFWCVDSTGNAKSEAAALGTRTSCL